MFNPGARLTVLTLTAAASAAGLLTPSLARADGGTVSATVTVAPPAVRSVTVTPNALAFGGCTTQPGAPSPAGLSIPNGRCHTPDGTTTDTPITITNGQVAGQIYQQGSVATPSDNGQSWALCGPSLACSDFGNPGADQYQLVGFAVGDTSEQPPLRSTPYCDAAFDESGANPSAGCVAVAGQSAKEYLRLTGPSSTTDAASSFTTTVTWTAVP